MSIYGEIIEVQMDKLHDISTRIKAYDMDENVRVSIASDIDDIIFAIRTLMQLPQ